MKICTFLWVYYGYPSSSYEGISVEKMRYNCGASMAKRDDASPDIVAGVPDSGTAHAIGYSNTSGIPFSRPFIKYTPTWPRSFMPTIQSQRNLIAKMKLIPVRDLIQGRSMLLIDDSIVRGTTSRKIVEMLRTAGAKEVHMRISSPSVLNPCYFGIDTATSEELIGHSRSVEEICRFIGADSLKFLSLPDLLKTVAGSGCQFCTGCFDGDYPIDPETGEMKDIEG